MHIQTWQESKAHKNGHQNTFLTIFTHFWLFFGSAETLHALSIVSKPPHTFLSSNTCFQADCSFSTHFQLLSTIFSCFYIYIFPSAFTYSLLILSIFDHLYLFLTFFTQIRVLLHLFFNINFNYFHSFSTILDKNCFTPSSYSQTGSGRVGPRANRAWPCPRTVYNRTVKQRFSHQ